MELEEFSVGKRITVGEITLLPIIRTVVSCRKVNSSIVCFGSKTLFGLVAASPKWKRAMNATGQEVPISQYSEQFGEVKELLQSV